ncbi:MAG: hypothetical protein Q9M91_06400 [Candidatus Dojkabacteria bacterium]|nr:hypothetical protein [Candidatus Dojkabacteria bacterium]MDQ7021426.1 hypothetical protein [Candidatus Dojkabacteria bacterium]
MCTDEAGEIESLDNDDGKDLEVGNTSEPADEEGLGQEKKNDKVDTETKKLKVEICHIPNGNPENKYEITISENALDSHLEHGDYLGECVPPVEAKIFQTAVSYSISTDSSTWSEWANFPDNGEENHSIILESFDFAIEFGSADVFVKYKDTAGNISEVYSDSIFIIKESTENPDDGTNGENGDPNTGDGSGSGDNDTPTLPEIPIYSIEYLEDE